MSVFDDRDFQAFVYKQQLLGNKVCAIVNDDVFGDHLSGKEAIEKKILRGSLGI